MAELIERLIGERNPAWPDSDARGGIPVHEFSVAMDQFARGAVTQAQIQTIFELNAAEVEEARNIGLKVTSGNNLAAKIDRARAIEGILILAAAWRGDVRFFADSAAVRAELRRQNLMT